MKLIFEDTKRVNGHYPFTVQLYAPEDGDRASEPEKQETWFTSWKPSKPLPYLVRLCGGHLNWFQEWTVVPVLGDAKAIRIAIRKLDDEYTRQMREAEKEAK